MNVGNHEVSEKQRKIKQRKLNIEEGKRVGSTGMVSPSSPQVSTCCSCKGNGTGRGQHC